MRQLKVRDESYPSRREAQCKSSWPGFPAIQESTGCSTVECWTVDLADFKSISAFASRFENEGGGRLDILLENAGVLNTQFVPTADGWENTYVIAFEM
jgi:NAD(P)-dependent dehydrogenase (short-subunit alcohol dehydrogenase family)